MPLAGLRESIAIPRALVAKAAVWESMDQPATLREQMSRTDAAVDLSLTGRVLGYVGNPQLVGCLTRELLPDQITSCGELGQGHPACAWPGEPMRAGAAHQQLNDPTPDIQATTESEFAIHPAGAVSLKRLAMDLTDHVGQPGMAYRPLRWRSLAPREEACSGDLEYATCPLGPVSLIWPHLRHARGPVMTV